MQTPPSLLFTFAPKVLDNEWETWAAEPVSKQEWKPPWFPKEVDYYGKAVPVSWLKWVTSVGSPLDSDHFAREKKQAKLAQVFAAQRARANCR